MSSRLHRLALICLISICQACVSIKDHYLAVVEENTLEAYAEFLSRYSDSIYKQDIESRMESLRLESEGMMVLSAEQHVINEVWREINSATKAQNDYTPNILYPIPFAMSTERTAHLAGVPSTQRVLSFLTDYSRRGGNSERTIQVDRHTAARLRVRLYDLQRFAIPQNSYWEYLFIDFFLEVIEADQSESLKQMVERAQDIQASRNFRPCSDLTDAKFATRDRYSLTILVDGKYAAGGKPSRLSDYEDMQVDGFSAELDMFAQNLLNAISRDASSNYQASYDTMTGCKTRGGI